MYVGKSSLKMVKVRRNEFPYIISGLPNHEFGYALYGDLAISTASEYLFCSRSDDGWVCLRFCSYQKEGSSSSILLR
jgi:hypothetical protein